VARERESSSDRGRRAEDAAAAWLEGQGFEVVARNHATRRGEVDLVCREGATLVFVEVRARSRADRGSAAESVTPAKARRVVAAATDWAARHGGLSGPVRFDVVAVDLAGPSPRFQLFRGAFDARGATG
jgi:putative endonuclease